MSVFVTACFKLNKFIMSVFVLFSCLSLGSPGYRFTVLFGGRGGNFAALYKGIPISSGGCTTVVNSVEVPHFDFKEDSSFWMEHNVQVTVSSQLLFGSNVDCKTVCMSVI